MTQILLIDDDTEMVELLTNFLERYGFRVHSANSPSKGLALLKNELEPALVLLDIVLPGKSGLDVCREIRKFSEVPIIMVTARGDIMDRIIGLELGADDYLPKPFEPRELLARIQSVLKRTKRKAPETQEFAYEKLSLDVRRRTVIARGNLVELSASEFDALLFFAQHPGEVVPRDELLEYLRGNGSENFDRSVDTVISRLRTKLGDDPQNPEFIKTVWGSGYVFIANKVDK
jgi:DNA-binding response OmpR family regulator